MKRVIITHGPGFEPIDEARRITNISTGRLGTVLAEKCAEAGLNVLAMRGDLATYPQASGKITTIPFTTNADLLGKLSKIDSPESIDCVFHAAALCDYKVAEISSDSQKKLNFNKIPSSEGKISLILEPSIKVLPQLPDLFPNARIVGWKYELNGEPSDAIQAGINQINKVGSDACIVNGKAYGEGFGFLKPDRQLEHFNNLEQLADSLVSWTLSEHYTEVDDR